MGALPVFCKRAIAFFVTPKTPQKRHVFISKAPNVLIFGLCGCRIIEVIATKLHLSKTGNAPD
jgi:hypothetical protein